MRIVGLGFSKELEAVFGRGGGAVEIRMEVINGSGLMMGG